MEIIENNGLLFNTEKGRLMELVITGNNLAYELDALEKYNVKSIVLNRYYCERRINDLSFLKECPYITSVVICDDDFSLDGLYNLHGLERLVIQGHDTIDYSLFPNLKVLDTRQTAPYKFPDSLQTLYIWYMKLKGKTLSTLTFPKELKNLNIYWSDIQNLDGLPSGLNHFGIGYTRKLKSLSGLDNSSQTLLDVEIENCPNLRDYQALNSCLSIRKLLLIGCREISTIGFVSNMKKLEHFAFSGTLVEDKDLSPLTGIPSVYFTNNKSYNRKLKDFNA